MKVPNLIPRKKTSLGLNLPNHYGSLTLTRSTPDQVIVKIILGFVVVIVGGAFVAIHKSEPVRELVHKVVDKTIPDTEEQPRNVTLSRNGKLHGYVETEADISVREPS